MNATVYVATSFDGFIARIDGSLDWLIGSGDGQDAAPPDSENGDYEEVGDMGFGDFMASIDAMVMGRSTFEFVAGFAGPWPYGDTPIFVLSRTLTVVPDGVPDTVSLTAKAPADLTRELEEKGFSSLYIDGGRTIQSFLTAGLITRLIITRTPVIIGTGIPLFGPVPMDIHLEHIETSVLQNSFVQSTYTVLRE